MRKLIICLSPILLWSCAYFSPDYEKPKLDTPQQWNAKNLNLAPISESLPYLAWWQKFNDPQLNQYIESGLYTNQSIAEAKANLEAAQGQLSTIKLNWLPFVGLFSGYIGGNSQNSLTPIGNLGTINNNGSFFAILPAYTLNVFTNYTLQKQANYNVEAARNALLSVRLAVIGQVTNAYFANLAQAQLIEQFQQLNDDMNELVKISRAMDKQGLSTQVGLDELLSKQQIIQGELALMQNNQVAAQNALRYLLNQTPGTIKLGKKFTEINSQQIIPGNLPVNVLAARPDVIMAEEQLKAANEGISIASSRLLPSVNLNYFYAQGSGKSSGFKEPLPVNSSYNTNQQSYYGAYANWVISPSVFGMIKTNKAIFKMALANYKSVVTTALHEVDNSLAINNGLSQKLDYNLSAYNNVSDIVQQKQALYKRGITPYTVVLLAKVEQDIQSINLTQAKLQQLNSLVNVYQNLGGGYQYYSESELAESQANN
ncbi:MAG: hypothetical protein RLZZ293_470 [Pseudomonadota bacterium]|jgi:outer membrane protein TolC